ncbi:MAG: LysE family translocator [Candidatus Ranarchaeia archaeon]
MLLLGEWFLVGFTGAIVPGGVFIAIINLTSQRGWKAGELAIVGHAILEVFFVTLLSLGLSPILLMPTVQFWLPLFGGTVLTVSGLIAMSSQVRHTFSSSYSCTQITEQIKEKRSLDYTHKDGASGSKEHSFSIGLGIATSLANPYFVLWWATVGATFIARFLPYFQPPTIGVLPVALIISITHSSADFIWYSIVIIAVLNGRKILGTKFYSLLITGSGLIMVYLGLTYLLLPLSSLTALLL